MNNKSTYYLETLTPDQLGELLHAEVHRDSPDVQFIQDLIAVGCPINARNAFGHTALHWAAWNGHIEVVKFLVSKGADVNMRTEEYHQTPLHLASDSGHIPMMRFLIRYGADIHARDYEDRTPYDIANISIPNWNSFRAVIPELEPKYPHTF